MNRIIFTIGLLSVEIVSAQDYSGRVGINTITPSATLNIKSKTGKNSSTKNLELENANGTKMVTVLDNGYIGIGTTTPSSIITIQGTGNTSDDIRMHSYSDSESGSAILMGRYRGKVSSPSILQVGDFLGAISFRGYNGSSLNIEAGIDAKVESADNSTIKSNLLLYSTNHILLNTNSGNNVGIGVSSPAEKLDVGGSIRSSKLVGTGDRPVYADANGVLKIGYEASTSTIASTTSMECNATNRGKMNFVPNDSGNDVFGICLRNANGNYYWGYIYGGGNMTTGSGTFGSGL